MEIGLIVRMECESEAQRRFVERMFGDAQERPIFEDDVARGERKWFRVLDNLDTPDALIVAEDGALILSWLGWDSEELRSTLRGIAGVKPRAFHAVMQGDEGWYRLWIRTAGRLKEHKTWNGARLNDVFDTGEPAAQVLERLAKG